MESIKYLDIPLDKLERMKGAERKGQQHFSKQPIKNSIEEGNLIERKFHCL